MADSARIAPAEREPQRAVAERIVTEAEKNIPAVVPSPVSTEEQKKAVSEAFRSAAIGALESSQLADPLKQAGSNEELVACIELSEAPEQCGSLSQEELKKYHNALLESVSHKTPVTQAPASGAVAPQRDSYYQDFTGDEGAAYQNDAADADGDYRRR